MSDKNPPKEDVKPEEEKEVPHLEAPKFLRPKNEVITGVGETTKLIFKAKGVPLPELKWFMNKKEVIPDTEEITIVSHCETTLTITNGAQPEHDKTYTCQAANLNGFVKESVIFEAQTKPVKPEEEKEVPQPGAPKFIECAKDLIIRVGKTTKLTCKAKGVPMPQLKWFKNDTEVIPDTEGITIANHCETTLTIFNTQPEHGGTYTCQATNSAGSPVEQKVSLKVTTKDVKPEEEKKAPQLKAPKLWALKKLVKTGVGETATLTCEAKGVTMPELKWLKNDTEVTPATEGITISPMVDGKTTLTITNARPEHGGTYTCQATNSDGAQVETIVKFIVCDECACIRSTLIRHPTTLLLENKLDADGIKACKTELLQAINALMNGKGGYVLIHTTDPGYLDQFDQKVDDVLKTLTPYGSFYDEYFKRLITDDAQHVVFEVLPQKGDRLPYILYSHSKVSLNRGRADLTQGQLLTVVQRILEAHNSEESDTALATHRRDRFMANLVQGTPIMNNNVPFVENISMQAKGTQDDNRVIIKNIKDSGSLVGELWSGNFKLVQYISAFSKLRDGGSFYFGVREENVEKEKKRFFCNGFAFEKKQRAEIEEAISHRLKTNMLWVGTRPPPQNLVTVKLHLVRPKASSEQLQTQHKEELQQQHTQKQKNRKTKPQQQEKTQQEMGKMKQDPPQPQATVSPPDAVTHGQRGSDDPAEGQPQLYILEIKTGHYAQGLLFHKKEGPEVYNICSISKKPYAVHPEVWVKIYDPSETIRSTPKPPLHPQCP